MEEAKTAEMPGMTIAGVEAGVEAGVGAGTEFVAPQTLAAGIRLYRGLNGLPEIQSADAKERLAEEVDFPTRIFKHRTRMQKLGVWRETDSLSATKVVYSSPGVSGLSFYLMKGEGDDSKPALIVVESEEQCKQAESLGLVKVTSMAHFTRGMSLTYADILKKRSEADAVAQTLLTTPSDLDKVGFPRLPSTAREWFEKEYVPDMQKPEKRYLPVLSWPLHFVSRHGVKIGEWAQQYIAVCVDPTLNSQAGRKKKGREIRLAAIAAAPIGTKQPSYMDLARLPQAAATTEGAGTEQSGGAEGAAAP